MEVVVVVDLTIVKDLSSILWECKDKWVDCVWLLLVIIVKELTCDLIIYVQVTAIILWLADGLANPLSQMAINVIWCVVVDVIVTVCCLCLCALLVHDFVCVFILKVDILFVYERIGMSDLHVW